MDCRILKRDRNPDKGGDRRGGGGGSYKDRRYADKRKLKTHKINAISKAAIKAYKSEKKEQKRSAPESDSDSGSESECKSKFKICKTTCTSKNTNLTPNHGGNSELLAVAPSLNGTTPYMKFQEASVAPEVNLKDRSINLNKIKVVKVSKKSKHLIVDKSRSKKLAKTKKFKNFKDWTWTLVVNLVVQGKKFTALVDNGASHF